MNTIDFKGVSSTSIDGLLICELPPISKPPMRVLETSVDGRHGTIIDELGYSAYDKTVRIGLRGTYDINKVIKYFSGEGDIVFSNEPDKVYSGRVIGQVDYTRLLRFRQANVTFRVQPFKHKNREAFVETQTATASGTDIILKDCGATPMKIATDAESVVVHGKNLFNASAVNVYTNASIEVLQDGYKIITTGGTAKEYAHSGYTMPQEMKGKTYTIICDKITSTQPNVSVGVQVVMPTSTTTQYFGVFNKGGSSTFTVPTDAVNIQIGLYTNNTNTVLQGDNTIIVEGLRIVPTEFKSDAWCKYQSAKTIPIVDGVATAIGIEPVTVISNADNVEMSVEYFKPFEVFNEGLETSKPLVVVNGSGTIEMKVNGFIAFTYTFPDGEDEVVLDCEAEEAYLGAVLKNRNMLGDFPELQPKTNKVEWTGDVQSIKILPRSRWL